jgi:hypothetical protein
VYHAPLQASLWFSLLRKPLLCCCWQQQADNAGWRYSQGAAGAVHTSTQGVCATAWWYWRIAVLTSQLNPSWHMHYLMLPAVGS